MADVAHTVDVAWARAWVQASAAVVGTNRMALNDLDRAIGDGDHGENLDRGYTAALAKLEAAETGTVGDVFALVAKTLMSTVGGAAGPLYGTAYLRAAKAAPGETVDAAGVAEVLEAALGGIVARGKAELEDKTMVDAWSPAADAAREVATAGGSAREALTAAARAARAGAQATEPLIARKGRASYLGARSQGHRDPGAESSALLLEAAAEVAGDA
ncbi:dihydroxyacetone kinase subunit DhaL [Ruania halotolerans]|uniref:dihydroxyacetone kinase subunit DhaL n=1 Tax=Ruania halotolerans TaxID=2897773 RepID=UPI001E5DA241|nr:dihydroxyacetone kinase subunit DhaL [Ruania halotolerans]UFU05242.1 dihydroxyacetone kinase subunit L [Ruania halotolerans]